MIGVPVLSPRVSGLWLGLVTPYHASVGRQLVESLRTPTVIEDAAGLAALGVRPAGVAAAIADALEEEAACFHAAPSPALAAARAGARYLVDARRCDVAALPGRVFDVIANLGGAAGWRYADWLWRLRGALDRAVGGVGLRRAAGAARTALAVGGTLDFWRIEVLEPGRRLRLVAEMKVPGRAWLDFEVVPATGGATIQQTAVFEPRGVAGRAYWYALLPLHRLVFAGMLAAIAAASVRGGVRGAGRARRWIAVLLRRMLPGSPTGG
jgi:hypothetical protein